MLPKMIDVVFLSLVIESNGMKDLICVFMHNHFCKIFNQRSFDWA